MADDRSIRVRLEAQVQQYRAGMAQAAASTKEFGREISGQGDASRKQMEAVGRSALLMAGGVAVGLGLSVKAALDWESAWAGVTKTVDGSASQMAALEGGLRDLAKELPATHGEIAAVAEAAGQLGIKREAIIGFTETMVNLGETTNLTADQAATAMAQMANIMQTPQREVDRMGASLVALGNAGASTESEILDMSLRLAGAGKLIGATEADVMAMANAMASVGIEAQLGGGSMSRVMQKIYTATKDGGEAVQGFAEIAGMSADEFTEAFETDPMGAIDAFIQGLSRIEASGGNVVGALREVGIKGTEEMSVLLRLKGAGDLLAESLDLGARAWEQNTALTDEASKRYETTAAKLEVLRNNVVEVGIGIGDTLLPVLATAADGASSMARGFGEIPGPAKAALGGISGLVGAGAGAVGIVGTLGPKVREAREALMSMGSAGQFVGRNLGTITLAAGGAMAAIAVYTYWLGEQAKEQAAAADLATRFTDAIREQGREIGAASDEVAASELLEGGLGEKMREASADVETLSRGIQEHADDVSRLNEAYVEWLTKGMSKSEALQKALEETGLAGTEMADELARLGEEGVPLNQLVERADQLAEGWRTGAREAENQAAATDSVSTSSQEAVGALEDMGGALGMTGAAAEEAEELVEAFSDAIDRIIGQAFDFEAASDGLEQAIIDAGTHFKEQAESLGSAGLALEGNSAAALANREVMRGLIDQSAEVIRAGQAQGMTSEQLTLIREAEKQKLRELATRYGLNQDVVEGYIGVLDGIPIAVGTTIKANTTQGYAKIIQVRDALGQLKDKTITIGVTTALGANAANIMAGKDQRWGGIVHSYASGGIHAHVARDEMLRYAEPGTGGEAFVPRLGDRSRSAAVLDEAASWYGLAVVPAGGRGQQAAGGPAGWQAGPGGAGGTVIQSLHLVTPDPPRQWLDEIPWKMAGVA